MRILYFSRDYSSHDYRFLTGLAKSGHAIGYLRLEKRTHSQELRPLPIEVESIPWYGGKSPARLRYGLSLLNDLKRVISYFKPDLIQAGPIQQTAFLAALTGFQPLVSMSWGYDLLIDARRNTFWRWATRYTLQHSAALIGDCNITRQIAITYGMPANKIVTFPWGIDLDHFHPNMDLSQPAKNAQATPLTLLSTRSWEPIYGVDVLARGFVKAAAQEPSLHLVMLNNGSQADVIHKIFAPVANNQANPEGAGVLSSPRVIFPGQIGYGELPNYYHSADLYLATTHTDGTSISLLEAMACGTPVLVSDIPGNREWVEHGHNGWLFPDGDSDALASAILHAVDSRHNLPEMGRAARRIAEQRANWSQNFPKLMNAYEIALNIPAGGLRKGL
jgi:glycosyltransferase involved in cell wall biosynthesis